MKMSMADGPTKGTTKSAIFDDEERKLQIARTKRPRKESELDGRIFQKNIISLLNICQDLLILKIQTERHQKKGA